jgi:Sulfotransferase domain
MRWNFSSRARELSGADAIVISIPKSGRTWVRTFLSAYFAYKKGKQFSLDFTDRRQPGVPRIVYSHDRFEDRTKGNAWDRLRGKYLIPRRSLRQAPIVLLARDPRDAFVSYFVQLTRRNPATPGEIKKLPVGDLLRHPRFGLAIMVEVMNDWLEEFGDRSDFSIARYEELRADSPRAFHELLRAIGEKEIDDAVFGPALDNLATPRSGRSGIIQSPPGESRRVSGISLGRRPELRRAGLCRAQSTVWLRGYYRERGAAVNRRPFAPAGHPIGWRRPKNNCEFLLDD